MTDAIGAFGKQLDEMVTQNLEHTKVEPLPSAAPASSIVFAARKVRMAREYYVEATAPDRAKYRIGCFKVRAAALEWIETHAANWMPEQANVWGDSEGFSLCSDSYSA